VTIAVKTGQIAADDTGRTQHTTLSTIVFHPRMLPHQVLFRILKNQNFFKALFDNCGWIFCHSSVELEINRLISN